MACLNNPESGKWISVAHFLEMLSRFLIRQPDRFRAQKFSALRTSKGLRRTPLATITDRCSDDRKRNQHRHEDREDNKE